MTFIRLAGCTVGKPYTKEKYQSTTQMIYHERDSSSDRAVRVPGLPIYTEECTLYDGRKFPCDTDYRVKSRMTSRLIAEEIPKNVEHVCITGGEPLMHNLNSLFLDLMGKHKKIHIETSGTIAKFLDHEIWVTVSPKFNTTYDMVLRADEVKILVDNNFKIEEPMITIFDDTVQSVNLIRLAQEKPVYLQPVNFEKTVNDKNLDLCLELQQQYPVFRVCCQLHKFMSASIGKEVR